MKISENIIRMCFDKKLHFSLLDPDKQKPETAGEIAKIVFIHNNSPSRPIVHVDNAMIDLLFEPSLVIEEIV